VRIDGRLTRIPHRAHAPGFLVAIAYCTAHLVARCRSPAPLLASLLYLFCITFTLFFACQLAIFVCRLRAHLTRRF
jgi:hypothetical protein